MIRVPLIKQYGDIPVNACDIALGLDRFDDAQLKSIDFQLVPITDDNGKQTIRLIPKAMLSEGVYFATPQNESFLRLAAFSRFFPFFNPFFGVFVPKGET